MESGRPALHVTGTRELTALRRVLLEAGYTEPGLREVQAGWAEGPDGRPDVAVYLRQLSEPIPLHTFVKLFVLGVSVSRAEARRAFAPMDLESLARTGIIHEADGRIASRTAITAVGELLVCYDPSGHHSEGLSRDHVPGLGHAPRALASCTVRQPLDHALDLGTGSGIQALLAAGHSGHVVATDTNPRALEYAAFNAALNGIRSMTFLRGDWFEPVGATTFDLIVCNPPFVISPEGRFTFRDGGLPGHDLCRAIVRGAGGRLNEGGYASILCNWGHGDVTGWDAPLRAWVADLGCDAFLIREETFEPLQYAAMWNRGVPPGRYEEALDTWTDHLAQLGFGAVSSGAVVLRKRATSAGRRWVRAVEGVTLAEPLGEHLHRLTRAEDVLAEPDAGDILLHRPLRLAEDHRVEQMGRLHGGRLVGEGLRLRLVRGLRSDVELDAGVLPLLAQLDGVRPLADVAEGVHTDTAEERVAVEAKLASLATQLLRLGFAELDPSG